MPVAPSFQDLLDQGMAEALSRRPDLLFAEGDVSLAQLHAGAAMADASIRFAAQAFAETFLDSANGDALTVLVNDHINIQRQPATAATVTLSFSRTSSGAAGSIPAGTTVATAIAADGSSVSFTANSTVAVGAGLNGPFTVNATAAVNGRATNVAAGTVTRITSSLFDTFTVTNPAAAAGGNEVESDVQLRLRARLFWQTLRRGTLAALEFGALQVASVRVARAVEDGSGLVTLVVTDETGNSNAQMVADTMLEIENWRAAGSVVNVVGGAVLLTNIAMEVYLQPGVSLDPLRPLLEDAIAGRMEKLTQGGILRIDQLTAAAVNVDPDGIDHVDFTSPSGDVTPTTFQVIRTGVITITEG